jgi:hypothetical protein
MAFDDPSVAVKKEFVPDESHDKEGFFYRG